MLKFFSKRLNNNKGFTLIELIVVIAILAILALIAIPRIGQFRSRAAISSHNANVRTLESAATMYLAEEGIDTSQTWEESNGKDTWSNYVATWPTIPNGLKGAVDSNIQDSITDKYTVTISDKGVVEVKPELLKEDGSGFVASP